MPFTSLEGLDHFVWVSKGGSIWGYRNIRDLEGADQAVSLGLMVEDLVKDVGEWHRLNNSDLTPLVKEELRIFQNKCRRHA